MEGDLPKRAYDSKGLFSFSFAQSHISASLLGPFNSVLKIASVYAILNDNAMFKKTRGRIQDGITFDLHLECCAALQFNDDWTLKNANIFNFFFSFFFEFDFFFFLFFLSFPSDNVYPH